ncbi:RGCVC family protein [Amycolatopsis australiensis]|uniref:RGCVC family protein n=1 Tax=Amycolatopsis australiensis TaxID=546364 RepID=UPI0009315D67|nr:RGCVC family protein [Amycolatopsis australiensis]
MTRTEVKPRTVDTGTSGTAGIACAACPHGQDSHDVIARRYCTAAVAGGFHRGCVCVGGNGEPMEDRS